MPIGFIEHPRKRSSAFWNRRSGILKKCFDLGTVCGIKISVAFTDLKGNIHSYSNTSDFEIKLKKSAFGDLSQSRLRWFSYGDEDYPFNKLSHVGRDFKTCEIDGGGNGAKLIGEGGDGVLRGLEGSGGLRWVVGEPGKVLKKRNFRLLCEELEEGLKVKEKSTAEDAGEGGDGWRSTAPGKLQDKKKLKTENPFKKSHKKEITQNHHLEDTRRKEDILNTMAEPPIQQKSRDLDFSSQALRKGQTCSRGQKRVNTPKKHKNYIYEDFHLSNLKDLINSHKAKLSQKNHSKRLRRGSPNWRDNINAHFVFCLEDFHHFFAMYIDGNFDKHLMEFFMWRYLITLYLTNQPSAESKLLQQIPPASFADFVALRPTPTTQGSPSHQNRESPQKSQKQTSPEVKTTKRNQKKRKSATQSQDSTKNESRGQNRQPELYRLNSLNPATKAQFMQKLAKYFEIILQILLQRITPTSNFDLKSEAQKIETPTKFNALKRLILKRKALLRSAFLIIKFRDIGLQRVDQSYARKIINAESYLFDVDEDMKFEQYRKMESAIKKFNLMNWVKMYDVIVKKF